ncbi:MAG: hypothetical protein HYX26_01165 [Acidobacteriales bacterium]|nr:hypothetical protein [Terriglobales bacterium]
MRVYLSGAIEYAPGHGRAWRARITPVLESLGHSVYDPALDAKKNLTDEELADFRSWKMTDLPRFQQAVRKIIAWDLDWIAHRTDFVVCYWDEHCGRGAGTQGELTFAHRQDIPVYLVAGMPLEQISGWILACSTEVFQDFDALQQYLCGRYAMAAVLTEPGKTS